MMRDRFIRDVLPALVWMALIFDFSTNTGSATHTNSFLNTFLARFFPGFFHRLTWPELDAIHYYIRKAAHVTEYAILAVLLARAFRGNRTLTDRRVFMLAWGVCALYAATDEFHQSYVPGRTPKVTDVLIDASGALLGLALTWFVVQRRRQKHAHPTAPLLKEGL